MKRLLVPTDFSEVSRIAVEHAVELSDAVGAELRLLHVVDVTMVRSPIWPAFVKPSPGLWTGARSGLDRLRCRCSSRRERLKVNVAVRALLDT
jgi:nucleotide-binding universal stress UspA family protein